MTNNRIHNTRFLLFFYILQSLVVVIHTHIHILISVCAVCYRQLLRARVFSVAGLTSFRGVFCCIFRDLLFRNYCLVSAAVLCHQSLYCCKSVKKERATSSYTTSPRITWYYYRVCNIRELRRENCLHERENSGKTPSKNDLPPSSVD